MNQFNRNVTIKPTLLSLVAVTVLFLTSSLAFAQESARVYLQPVDSAAGTLTVDVIAENVTNMYGAEFRLTYDPTVVSVQDTKPEQEGIQIEAGSLLPVDKGFVVMNRADETEGKIVFAMTLLNPAPAVSGSGPLARVTFNVLHNGPSIINVDRAKLVAIDLQTIPSETVPLPIGSRESQIETAAPTITDPVPPADSTASFPWWIVAVGVMILGLLTLGAFVLMTGLHKSSQTASVRAKPVSQKRRTVSPTHQRPQHMTGTRPSAFK